jgi:hypothetical protein
MQMIAVFGGTVQLIEICHFMTKCASQHVVLEMVKYPRAGISQNLQSTGSRK